MKAMAGFGLSLSQPTVATLADGRTRCSWVAGTGMDLVAYHNDEWGTVTRDTRLLFEALCLTYFENGLSWSTVYRKRRVPASETRRAYGQARRAAGLLRAAPFWGRLAAQGGCPGELHPQATRPQGR